MEKITVLLPEAEVERHIIDICSGSDAKFDIGRGLAPFDKIHVLPGPPRKVIFLRQAQENSKPIGYVHILPVRNNSIVKFVAESPSADFDEFARLVTEYFQGLELLPEKRTAVEQEATQVDAAKPEFSNFDPPHHEHTVKAKPDDVTQTITEIIKEDMGDLKINHALQGKYFQYDPQALQNGHYTIFVYERFYNKNGEELRLNPLGEIIQFKFTEYKLSNTIKIQATCHSENALVREYFESLWKQLNKHFPDMQEAGQAEKPQSRGTPSGLIGEAIHHVARNTTGVIAGPEYDQLTTSELKQKAARFDAMRYGDMDIQAAQTDLTAKPERGGWDKMNKSTKENFRKAWKIYSTMCKEYKNDVLDGASQKAKPSIQDFRARVIQDMNWSVGDRRLRDVIAYGEAKLIE